MTEIQLSNLPDTEEIAEASQSQAVDYLENLLTRQMEKLKKYDLDGAMGLGEQTAQIAANVAREGLLDKPEFAEQNRRIRALYKDIGLIIASEREEVADKLRQIRRGLRALGFYKKNA